MIKLRQHIPNFVDGVDGHAAHAETIAELLAVPWVARYADEPDFYRWSQSDDRLLMLEQDHGYKWWVVGYLKSDQPIDLPKWRAKYLARLADGTEVSLENGEVSSSCGGDLWLRDGTKAKDIKRERERR